MKLFLIDGHALIFKMYYAFLGRPMINSRGVDTSILFGFTKYLLEMLHKESPSHVAVSFDPPGGTFRNKLYPEYKANRGETPQLVIDALEPLTAICKALKIPVLMIPGFEADDVIGSMAKKAAREGFEVYMVTPDKDYGQLVEDTVFQYRPGKSGTDNEVLGPAEICAKWKISSPAQVVDILAICGDSADNVPGVNGVGPVGAAKLLQQYGSVESIYEHIGELTARQQGLFEAARDHITLSKELVTIKTDIPLETSAEDMVLDASWNKEVEELFDLYEFRSLRRLVSGFAESVGFFSRRPAAAAGHADGMQSPGNSDAGGSAPAATENSQGGASQVRNSETAAGTVQAEPAAAFGKSSISYETCSPEKILQAASQAGECAMSGDGRKFTVAAADGDGILVCTSATAEFKALIEDGKVQKFLHSSKKLMNELAAKEMELGGKIWDIELMHYLLNPERSHALEDLAGSYLGVQLENEQQLDSASLFLEEEDTPQMEEDRGRKTAIILRLGKLIRKEARDGGIIGLYDKIEEPLIGVLSRMERNGVKVDVASLQLFAAGLRKRMHEKEAEVRSIAGDPELNVGSPKQIGELIYEKLKLDPKQKKNAHGSYSTDEETLLALADRSPVIDAILDYRGTRKLLSTYIEPFPEYISQIDGRVHTTFNQALTSTGRLSSSNPNLQNIPIRTEEGREIRKAFVPDSPDSVMMSADYSQIELRIMAHLSCDRHLIEAFREGIDVHAATAAKIFGIPVGEVSADQRRIAKTANFGILYGISAFGLAQRLRCPRSEAKKLIEDYFASFPSVKEFIAATLETARENGYAETIFGRRRYLPDLKSKNGNIRSFAERNAVNAPIQGSAADIIKLAMIGVDRRLREDARRSRLVLQIHDELVLEVPSDEIEPVQEMLVREMENVTKLSVPLTVECNYGKTWLEAH